MTARNLADVEELEELGGYTKELNREALGAGVIAALGPARTRDWLDLKHRVTRSEYVGWIAWALTIGKSGGVANPEDMPSSYEAWEMANAFFNCTDPKTQPEFLYRRGSLFKVSENCLAADATVARRIWFMASRVTDRSDKKYDPRKELIGF